jgi:3-methylfumaryl-CoA hydratase
MTDSTGTKMTLDDYVDPWRTAALHATLDRPGPPPAHGAPLPALWHFILFREAHPTSALGRDGHPKPGDFLPDTGLPRRMWAGGRFRFREPLKIGENVRRVSVIQNMAVKQGGAGPLAFVTVRHEITGPGGLAVREEQDIVYRGEAGSKKSKPAPRTKDDKPAWRREYRLDVATLFRYSALTFNAHRIHYDRNYARDVEGYPSLVVHGPLLAQLMMDLLIANSEKPVFRYSFRGEAPVFCGETFAVCGRSFGDKTDLWIVGEDGGLRMTGEARHAEG